MYGANKTKDWPKFRCQIFLLHPIIIVTRMNWICHSHHATAIRKQEMMKTKGKIFEIHSNSLVCFILLYCWCVFESHFMHIIILYTQQEILKKYQWVKLSLSACFSLCLRLKTDNSWERDRKLDIFTSSKTEESLKKIFSTVHSNLI